MRVVVALVDSHAGAASFKSSSSHGGCAAGGASFRGSPNPVADSGGKSHCIVEIGSTTGTFGTALGVVPSIVKYRNIVYIFTYRTIIQHSIY